MSSGPETKISVEDRALQARFRWAGILILAAGLTAAGLANWNVARDDRSRYEKTLTETKRYDLEMEMIGGKANIFASDVRDWIGSLWHGKRLVHTLTFLTIGGSAMCFFVAHRLGYPPRQGRARRPKAG